MVDLNVELNEEFDFDAGFDSAEEYPYICENHYLQKDIRHEFKK